MRRPCRAVNPKAWARCLASTPLRAACTVATGSGAAKQRAPSLRSGGQAGGSRKSQLSQQAGWCPCAAAQPYGRTTQTQPAPQPHRSRRRHPLPALHGAKCRGVSSSDAPRLAPPELGTLQAHTPKPPVLYCQVNETEASGDVSFCGTPAPSWPCRPRREAPTFALQCQCRQEARALPTPFRSLATG